MQRERRIARRKLPYQVKSLFYSPDSTGPHCRGKRIEVLHKEPKVFLIHDFINESELEHIDMLVTESNKRFSSSFTEGLGYEDAKVYSEERTSTFTYLTKSQDKVVRQIESRAADLVGVPSTNVEPLQIVRYAGNQRFTLHHDAGTILTEELYDKFTHALNPILSDDIELVQPIRIATLFVYLNDLPAGLGCTEFPFLSLQVQPKRGAAVVFGNLLPDGAAEPLTCHQALPLNSLALLKYGMNVWVCMDSLHELNEMVSSRDSSSGVGNVNVFRKRETLSALEEAELLTQCYVRKHEASSDGYWNEDDTEEENREEIRKEIVQRRKQPLLATSDTSNNNDSHNNASGHKPASSKGRRKLASAKEDRQVSLQGVNAMEEEEKGNKQRKIESNEIREAYQNKECISADDCFLPFVAPADVVYPLDDEGRAIDKDGLCDIAIITEEDWQESAEQTIRTTYTAAEDENSANQVENNSADTDNIGRAEEKMTAARDNDLVILSGGKECKVVNIPHPEQNAAVALINEEDLQVSDSICELEQYVLPLAETSPALQDSFTAQNELGSS